MGGQGAIVKPAYWKLNWAKLVKLWTRWWAQPLLVFRLCSIADSNCTSISNPGWFRKPVWYGQWVWRIGSHKIQNGNRRPVDSEMAQPYPLKLKSMISLLIGSTTEESGVEAALESRTSTATWITNRTKAVTPTVEAEPDSGHNQVWQSLPT